MEPSERPPQLPIEPRQARFREGQRVQAEADLINDGSHPNFPAEALLVASGVQGEVVQVGHHVDANLPVYMVEFSNGVVVGCFEEELAAV